MAYTLDGNPAEMRSGSINPATIPLGQILSYLQAEPRDAVVYFARRGRFVKIGTTRRLHNRMAALASARDPDGNVGPVELLTTLPGGRVTEGGWHARFSASSVDGYGEWFHADADVLGFVLRCLRIDCLALTAEGRAQIDAELMECLHGLLR